MKQAASRKIDTRGSRPHQGEASARRDSIAMAPPGYGIELADGPIGEKVAPLPAVSAIQTKPKIGPPNDKYEEEADRVAETVMRMPLAVEEPEEKLENNRVQTKPFAGKIGPAIDVALSDGRDRVQPFSMAENRNGASDNPAMESAAHAAIRNKGPGNPLEPTVRNRLERGIGSNLGHVRVHHDPHAHSAARQLNARAFTHSSDIWLGRGESPTDLQLMAHEATHVVQQGSAVRRLAAEPARQGRSPSPPTSSGVPSRSMPSATGTTTPAPAPVSVTPLPESSPPSSAPEAPAAEALPAAQPQEPAPGATESAPVATLLMPEPPNDLSDADRQRLAVVGDNASDAAATQSDLPSAVENVSEARGAVTEPGSETAARAEGALVSALGRRPEPSPEIEALCQRILAIIHSRQPPDEASLVQSNPRQEAREAGGVLESAVGGDVQRVEGSYQQLNTPPAGSPQRQAQDLQTPAESVPSPGIHAEQAVPDAVPAENVSLNADVEASTSRMSEAGMHSAPAQLVQSGPIAEARAAQGDLTTMAARDPAQVLAQQQAAREQAATDMAELQARALTALQSSRATTARGVGSQQGGMVTSEELLRAQISERARNIFNSAQERVNTLLEPLTATALRRWETGVEILSGRFESDLARVQRYLDERYSGVGGKILEFFEDIVGKPAWVTRAYDRAERNFADGVCNLIREISAQVNSVITTCQQIIDDANTQIAGIFSQQLPAGLQQWAASEQARFAQQLEGLRTRVTNTRDDFNASLAERAAQSVQQVRERIHELRQAAGGLIGRIVDAVNRFVEDPAKFIIEGLLELVGIAPAAFWAVVNRIETVIQDIANNPINFANNLVTALGQGFQRFFDNFSDHILGGFFDWLFSGLGAVGVEIPRDFSLKSIITFFLQLMGITWARIRQLLARHIGEENVALIERAYEIIANLIEMGPRGIFELIKEQLNPRNLLDQVLQAAIDFLVETLIVRVSARIIAMFNPAGAIIQAIELIYRVLRWIFDNAARIFSLVETVVNGAAALIAGNLGGMVTAIEGALARLIAPVIDFLAGFLGLGALPDRIADTIRGFQDWVMGILERVVRWLADRARSLLRTLGMGGQEDQSIVEGGSGRQQHEQIADRIHQQLSSDINEDSNLDDLLILKRDQATQLHQTYAHLIGSGLVLTIELSKIETERERPGIELEVTIRPNTTRRGYRIFHRDPNLFEERIDILLERALDDLTDVLYAGSDREEDEPDTSTDVRSLSRGIQRTIGTIQRNYASAARGANNTMTTGGGRYFVDQVRNYYVYPYENADRAEIISSGGQITTVNVVTGFDYRSFNRITVGSLFNLLYRISGGGATGRNETAMLIASIAAEPFRYGPSHITNLILLTDYSRHHEPAFSNMAMTTGSTDPISSRDISSDPDGRGAVPEEVRERQVAIIRNNTSLFNRLVNFYNRNEEMSDVQIVTRFKNIIRDFLNRQRGF